MHVISFCVWTLLSIFACHPTSFLVPSAQAFSIPAVPSIAAKADIVIYKNSEINDFNGGDDCTKQLDVAIVGAGPAGLVLAHAMLQRGYSVRVLERRDAFRPVGAAVFMHPFAMNSLRNISPEVEQNLRESCTPIRTLSIQSLKNKNVNISTNKLDDAVDAFGSPFVAIRFWDMLCALKKGLPDEIFQFGHEIQGFEQLSTQDGGGVRVKFVEKTTNGQGSFRATILIDAGGIRSKIRQQLIGDKPIPRLRATYAVAAADQVQSVLGNTDHRSESKNGFRKLSFVSGDGVSVLTASLANGDVWWTQTRYNDNPTESIPVCSKQTLEELLKERFSIWPTHVKGLVDATGHDDIIESTISELPITWKWGLGYDVTLLGDAAHAQLPGLGLGVSTAFADVDELCRQIDRCGLSRTSLRWYEFVRIPQTAFLQLASRMAYFAFLWGTNVKT